jgi:3-hydroxyisobutyrate dehydrogenase-like beta-hydroxyacid dehydrogenase
MPSIAIIAQGAMGAGIAQRLSAHGAEVVTCLDGRSPASAARAAAAGMRAASAEECARADLLLSVLPPAEALAMAERYAPLLAPTTLYADCNAISPALVERIAAVIAPSGAAFADAGIIGAPPRPDGYTPKLYASGPGAARLAALEAHGLKVPVLDGPVGAASALKMCYAGITKGTTALASAMFLAATRAGAAAALHAELAESQALLLPWLNRFVSMMYDKAYRWEGEMDEIAAFLSDDAPRGESAIYAGMARLYARLAADNAAGQEEVGALRRFLAQGDH